MATDKNNNSFNNLPLNVENKQEGKTSNKPAKKETGKRKKTDEEVKDSGSVPNENGLSEEITTAGGKKEKTKKEKAEPVTEPKKQAKTKKREGKTSEEKLTARKDNTKEKKSASKKTIAVLKEVAKRTEEPATIENKEEQTTPKETAQPLQDISLTLQEKAPVLKEETATAVEEPQQSLKKVILQIRYHTKYGEVIYVTGNHELFGNDITKALQMQYLNEEYWSVELPVSPQQIESATRVNYNYFVKNIDGTINYDWGRDKVLNFNDYKSEEEVVVIDSWNSGSFYENAFYTEPFQQVLLKDNYTAVAVESPETFTHSFKVKAPLLNKGEALCMLGNTAALGNWEFENAVLMQKKENEDFWSTGADLTEANFPVAYKYAVYDTVLKEFIRYEAGQDRLLYDTLKPAKKTIVNDGFIVLPADTWKGAGVAVPVFSLRSENSFGVGEFTDLKLLVDWAKKVGLKLVQVLPVNDTTANHSWADSYPYAAISAFALHPMYLNLDEVVKEENKHWLLDVAKERAALNRLEEIDYLTVNETKWQIIKSIYPSQKKEIFESEDYKQFFEKNKHWLVPYAAFCYLRDKYNTSNLNQWRSHQQYVAEEIETLVSDPANADIISIHYFIQYHLHIQLLEATHYAHENGIILKGDIPIGIYRYGADAWQQPQLYHMDMQAGAPPDDFAVKGQNWGFPTYNWQKMKQDGFAWWKQRFEQMSYYFDAFRIDHILGFFRIWSIPIHSVEGIMGYFVPALPVHINEFHERRIWFDYNRYTRPFINNQLLSDVFGDQQQHVRYTFLDKEEDDKYNLKQEFSTQANIEEYFKHQPDNLHNQWLQQSLFNLVSNVILFPVEGSNGHLFHFRFGIEDTHSFKSFDQGTQQQLKHLYINYFFQRQDEFWKREALQKLPALKRDTNMLICGEDLGMVPKTVPEVMKQLGLLSLEIQRMPKDPNVQFFQPKDAPYLSVVTPSTHDMSTIRGWWEEDRALIQNFYNTVLGKPGDAPYFCEAWINKAIILQHLNSPAMWCIFQMQDLLGIDNNLRSPNPYKERINVPADPENHWNYRMHLTLETLMNAEEYNQQVHSYIKTSGR